MGIIKQADKWGRAIALGWGYVVADRDGNVLRESESGRYIIRVCLGAKKLEDAIERNLINIHIEKDRSPDVALLKHHDNVLFGGMVHAWRIQVNGKYEKKYAIFADFLIATCKYEWRVTVDKQPNTMRNRDSGIYNDSDDDPGFD